MKRNRRTLFRKFFLNLSAFLGFFILFVFIVVAIFAPFIAPPKPNKNPYLMPIVTWNGNPEAPSPEHRFGIAGKRDIFYGVIWGTRTAFQVGIIVTFVSTFIGLVVGSIAGYFGKLFDEILMRVTDVFLAIPFLVAAMVFTTILGTGLDKVMIAMTVFSWMYPARLIRGNILQVKEEQYITAARSLGVSHFFIILRHVLPNSIFPVLIQASMRMGSLVITAASLNFLGIGAPQGYADWGALLNYSRNWMLGGNGEALKYWYMTVFPGTAMVLFVLSWNLVGDALRDFFDPRLRI
ncbi:MAG: ABC transporter permease [Candidatus Atribacteria bacterium]|nr:ABC transporter permease [Candidatus Atribacteria bacterium]